MIRLTKKQILMLHSQLNLAGRKPNVSSPLCVTLLHFPVLYGFLVLLLDIRVGGKQRRIRAAL